jgi:zinc protease
MTPETATRWVRRGAAWAILVACFSALALLARTVSNSADVSYWILLDVVLSIALGIGIWRRSRAAAVLMLAYWIASKVDHMARSDMILPPILGLLILGWVFFNAARATYTLHRIRAAESARAAPAPFPTTRSYRRERIAALLAAVIVVAALVAVQRSRDGILPGKAPSLNAAAPFDPVLRSDTLSNGVAFFIRPNNRPSNTTELRLVVNAGSVLEEPQQRGLAHAVEHMVFRGTTSYPGHRATDYLQSVGLNLGDEVNAHTSHDETVYRMTLPSSRPGIIDTAIAILAEWASAATFDTTEARQEAGVVFEEWRSGTTARHRLGRARDDLLLQGSQYAGRPVIGDTAVLRRFDVREMQRFYRNWYRPELMAVVAVGDFDADQLEATIRRRFGALPASAKRRTRPTIAGPTPPGLRADIVTDPEATTTHVALYYPRSHGKPRTVGDFRTALVEELTRHILEERLTDAADDPDSPLYFAEVGLQSLARTTEAHVVRGSVADGGVYDGIALLANHVTALERFGPSEAELERGRAMLLERRKNSDSYGYSSSYLIESIQWYHLHGDLLLAPDDEYTLASSLLPDIDSASVVQSARQFSLDSGATILATLRAGAADGSSVADRLRLVDAARDGANRAVAPTPRDSSAVPALTSAFSGQPRAGTIVKEEVHRDLTVFEWILSNGMRLLIKPTRMSDADFIIRITGPGGASLAARADIPSAYMSDRVVEATGVGAMTGGQIARMLDRTTLDVSPVVTDQWLQLTLDGELPDLESAFQLAYLHFTAARADSSAFRRYRDRATAYARDREANPDAAFTDSVEAALAPRSAGDIAGTRAFTAAIDLDKSLRFWRARTANAANFTTVIVGDVTLERLRPLVERYFASLPAGLAERARDMPYASARRGSELSFERHLQDKARTQLIFEGKEPLTPDTEPGLRNLRSALALVLENRLREIMGGTYSVDVGLSLEPRSPTRYVYSVDFEADPRRVDSLAATALAEIERLRKDGPGREDIKTLRAEIGAQSGDGEESNWYWASELTWHAQLAWPLETIKWHRDDTLAVTPARIAEAATRYLAPDRYLRVTIRPLGKGAKRVE